MAEEITAEIISGAIQRAKMVRHVPGNPVTVFFPFNPQQLWRYLNHSRCSRCKSQLPRREVRRRKYHVSGITAGVLWHCFRCRRKKL